MPHAEKQTGNPVFDYKAGFRVFAQSAQRVLFGSGAMLIVGGLAARFFSVKNPALEKTLAYAPWMGIALIALSCAWAFWWRKKLRRDFRRDYS